jgi:hypothetical protein
MQLNIMRFANDKLPVKYVKSSEVRDNYYLFYSPIYRAINRLISGKVPDKILKQDSV